MTESSLSTLCNSSAPVHTGRSYRSLNEFQIEQGQHYLGRAGYEANESPGMVSLVSFCLRYETMKNDTTKRANAWTAMVMNFLPLKVFAPVRLDLHRRTTRIKRCSIPFTK